MEHDDYNVLSLSLESHLQWLLERAARLRSDGAGGSTVFVAGGEGSGRTALLDAFVDTVTGGRSTPLVLSGTFESGQYAAKNHVGEGLARARRLVEGVVTVASPLHPVAALAGQIVSQSKGAWQVAKTLTAESKQEHPLALLPQLLRRAAQTEGPVVCVIDDADKSNQGWWADLMLSFARQLAVDLPLLLVFAVDGPEQLGEHELDEPPSLFVARQLAEDGLASWRPLRHVTASELADWIGPADQQIPRAISEITGGRASWAAEVWREWREDKVVVRVPRGKWSFSGDDRTLALAPVNHFLGRRLQNLLGSEDLRLLARAQQVLACAALEGRRFTAEAVAVALGQDRDEVINLLDDQLTAEGDSTQGLVDKLPAVCVTDEAGTRHLKRYRFRAELDLLVLRHYGFGDHTQRQKHAFALAEALHSLYGSESHRVARTLAELYTFAGARDAARSFQRMHNVATDHETMLWRARYALEFAPAAAQYERNRAVEVLLAAGRALYDSGPWKEGRRFTEAAAGLTDVLSLESSSLYYAAWFCFHLDDLATARRYLERALMGFEKIHDRDGIADARHQLANLDAAEGRYEIAEASYREVLRLRKARDNRVGQARVHEALGDIFHVQDDLPRARAEYETAVELERKVHHHLSYASTLRRLVRLDYEEDKFDCSRATLAEVLEIQREYGDRRNEVATLILLADLEYSSERFEAALAAASAALTILYEIENRNHAPTLHRIGNIQWALGHHDEACSAYGAALTIWDEVGNLEEVVNARRALGDLESDRSDWASARAHYERALQIEVETGNRAGEAHSRHRIADFLYVEARPREARQAYLEVLDLERELGDLESENMTHYRLGSIADDDGDTDGARSHFLRSLALDQELGDRHGEAITEVHLAAIDFREGDVDSARIRLMRALSLQRELGDTEGEAVTLDLLRQIAEEEEDHGAR